MDFKQKTQGESIMDINNEITQALFDMYDIKKTIESNNLNKIKRVHGGTDNEETLEELIDDVIYFLERLERIHEPLPDVFKPKLYLVKEEA